MSKKKEVYLIKDITEYGKLIAFCIKHDITIFRTYWGNREKGNRCYQIDWDEKRCYYSSRKFYEENGYKIVVPYFSFDRFGEIYIVDVVDAFETEKGE